MNGAVVDIGSNSTRLLIAAVRGAQLTELARRTEVTRLGAGVDAQHRLGEDAIGRVLATLDGYSEAITAHDCGRRVAVMTSAVRDAANGPELAALVSERYGLEAHVLPGEEEARLTYLGATSGSDAAESGVTLVIDIGGGSTELVLGSGSEIELRVSTQAGVVRQTERHLHGDPPSAAQLDALAADVRAVLAAAVPERRRGSVTQAIAVAGTATSLAAIAQRLEPYDPARVQGFQLRLRECERLLAQLAALPLERRRAVPGLHPDRAPTIVAGAMILREAMALFSLRGVRVSEHDILYGAFMHFISGEL
ncbi:MAG: Ppx/GppA phosphatase family protein [Solirubrobacteraceae bacterium]